MANQTGGFGFRQAPTVGSTPATGGQAEYKVKSGLGVGIFQNNPVSQQHTAGDDGYLQDASADTMDDGIGGGADWSTGTSNIQPIVGVFNGIFYINSSTSKPTFANHVLASTTFELAEALSSFPGSFAVLTILNIAVDAVPVTSSLTVD